MTDVVGEVAADRQSRAARDAKLIRKRYAVERRFRLYGIAGVIVALLALVVLIGSMAWRGHSAFIQSYVQLEFHLDAERLDPQGTRDVGLLQRADYGGLVRTAIRERFPEVKGRRDKRALSALISTGAADKLRKIVLEDADTIGTTVKIWVPLSDDADMFLKGYIDRNVPESERRLNDKQIAWLDQLEADGALEKRFNARFFASGDSREPELAGIRGAVAGSFFTLLVTLLLAFPMGVMTAIYLEEFAPKNRWTDLIEVNINNLAAVPSIVFGLLGLAVFLNFMNLPRSAPLVGGMVLALMTLPTIIISGRAALKAVPPSIREAALGVGASRTQAVTQHVLPLAMPGMLTGTIIGMAQALGETAPLLMIGMVAFIVDIPGGPTDPATVLPVQIFLWADSPERAFVERTAAATLVLLAFLVLMNAIAVVLRKKFERRW
ncbi:MAG: phosphate ABC transporter permease PstA [Alphaproteobacteria bacterium]|nr:phosphate ABC transporter permease PstA [Alphaproteobacteria bacterium]